TPRSGAAAPRGAAEKRPCGGPRPCPGGRRPRPDPPPGASSASPVSAADPAASLLPLGLGRVVRERLPLVLRVVRQRLALVAWRPVARRAERDRDLHEAHPADGFP